MLLIGLLSILLVVQAAWKGAAYIGASNERFNLSDVRHITNGRFFARWSFLATPVAFYIVGAWSGYSITGDLLFWLGDSGFVDMEGEWKSYRRIFSSTIGGPLGLTVAWWLLRLCEPIFVAQCIKNEAAPFDEQEKII